MLRSTFLKKIIRFKSTSASLIGKPLTNKEDILDFISTPKIQIHENLIKTLTPVEITNDHLVKLMKLSSLEIPSNEEDLIKYKTPLLEQIGFLSKVHELNPEIFEYNYNQSKGLKLNDIINNIKSQKQDPSKGEEMHSNAELLKLATYTKNNHYIVKEGLLKNKI